MEQTEQQKLVARWGQLKTDRSSWFEHWQEISNYLLPRSGKFLIQDKSRGRKRHNNIYDSTGTRALRILAAGMMSGMTSPARPWFRLTTSDNELDDYGPVKVWLKQVTQQMRDIFARSNTYLALHSMYEELGAFGTAPSLILSDYTSVIHHHTLTAGEYALATNYKGQVTTLYREFDKTVGEIVAEFGLNKVSPAVKNLYTKGTLDQWVTLMHVVEPRTDRDPAMRDARNMAWKSVYFEAGANQDKFLRESGFKEFPVICPRWAATGGDTYGSSPGMEALGDVKQLQQEQLRKAQGIDYMTNPPLQMPSSLKHGEVDSFPGGVTFVDTTGPANGIRTQFDVKIDLNHLLVDIQDVRGRINAIFYADLFMMLANQADKRMTATEVAERHEEKLLMLGPVLERLHNEMLIPKVDLTFSRMLATGIVPPPPAELQGQNLNVDFVSMLAQAQQAVGTNSVDRFVGTLGQIAQVKPDVLDKFDSDKWADVYSDMLGVDPELVVPGDKVALIRKARAEAQQKAQQAEQMPAAAQAAKNASQVDPQGLRDVIGMFSGYTS